MAEINDEAAAATLYARQRLSDELLHRADDRVQQRRQHALWCSAMTYAERGERCDTTEVLARADAFLSWLDRDG
jgi:hypothetical protein